MKIRLVRERRNLPHKRRKRVIKRDGGKCRYCGIKVREPHIDHVTAISRGGSDWSSNLVLSCWKCNNKKRTRKWIPRPLPIWRLVYSFYLMIVYGDYPRIPDFI